MIKICEIVLVVNYFLKACNNNHPLHTVSKMLPSLNARILLDFNSCRLHNIVRRCDASATGTIAERDGDVPAAVETVADTT